jgi:hypothetical protein
MENKVPNLLITLSEFRIIQLAKEGLPKLLLGLIFLFVLNSCSKEAAFDEVRPASAETMSVIKEWATKNDKLKQANLIEWNYVLPITLPDSSKGYSIPVKTTTGYKEFITFELRGKRYGLYKSYNLLNSTDMEIVIQTAEGKTVRSGFIRKKSASAPKGKSTSIREMNLEEEEEIVYDTWLDWVTISAPRLNTGGGGGFYFGNTRFDMNIFNYYMQAGLYNSGNGGGGSTSLDTKLSFMDYNYSKITNNLNDPCLNQVFSDLLNRNVYGEINEIISKFNSSVGGSGFSFKIQEMSIMEESIYPTYFGAFDKGTIKINRSLLKNSSKEGIAKTMVHEILHAYIKKDLLIVNDHEVMIKDYVFPIAEFLVNMYNIPLEDGLLLSLSGLQETTSYVQILSKMKITNNDVSIIRKLYTENLNYGKRCF